jgi:hypothetical protein
LQFFAKRCNDDDNDNNDGYIRDWGMSMKRNNDKDDDEYEDNEDNEDGRGCW